MTSHIPTFDPETYDLFPDDLLHNLYSLFRQSLGPCHLHRESVRHCGIRDMRYKARRST